MSAVSLKWKMELRWLSKDGEVLFEEDATETIGQDKKWQSLIKQVATQPASFVYDPVSRTSWMIERVAIQEAPSYLIVGPWLTEKLTAEDRLTLDEVRQFSRLLNSFYQVRESDTSQQKERVIHEWISFINDSFRSMNAENRRSITQRLVFLHAYMTSEEWGEEVVFATAMALLFKHLPAALQSMYLPNPVLSIVESYHYWHNWCLQKSYSTKAVQLHSVRASSEKWYEKEGQLLASIQLWFDLSTDDRTKQTKSQWKQRMTLWFGPLEPWMEKLVNFLYSWKLSQYVTDEMNLYEREHANDAQPQIENKIGNDLTAFIQSLTILSRREKEVLLLIIRGQSNKDISKALFISEHTVKHHVTNILNKLGVVDRFHAFVWLYQQSGL